MDVTKLLFNIFISSLLLLTACANTDSSNIKTSGFCPAMNLTKNLNSSSVSVSFTAGCGIGGSYIELSAEDSLSVQVNSNALQALSKNVILGIVSYTANINANSGDTIKISLHRESEGTYESSVVIPNSISINSPVDGSAVNNASTINATWTSGGGGSIPISYSWSYQDSGTTISKSFSTSTSDTGSFNIPAIYNTHSRTSAVAGAKLTIGRRQFGSLNSAFDTSTGAYIRATYEDTHTLSINQ